MPETTETLLRCMHGKRYIEPCPECLTAVETAKAEHERMMQAPEDEPRYRVSAAHLTLREIDVVLEGMDRALVEEQRKYQGALERIASLCDLLRRCRRDLEPGYMALIADIDEALK